MRRPSARSATTPGSGAATIPRGRATPPGAPAPDRRRRSPRGSPPSRSAPTPRGRSPSPPRGTRLLVQHPRLKEAAAILDARPGDVGEFDWRALRRAMLLMIEREAAAAIRVPAETLSVRMRSALHFGRDADAERVQRARQTMEAARQQIET